MTYWTCHQGASQEAFRNSHKRDLVGEPPGMGLRRFRNASCEATGIYLTKHLFESLEASGRAYYCVTLAPINDSGLQRAFRKNNQQRILSLLKISVHQRANIRLVIDT